jgi:hypothetical protein
MAFDPQKYLASKASETPAASVAKGFDPQLYLQNVGGNIITSDVPTVAGQVPNPPVVEPKRTMMDRVKALYEVPLTAASAAVAGPVSSAYGVYKSATSPQFGTQQGVQVGQQAQSDLARRMTYTPTSPVAQEFLQDVGQVAEAAKLPPVIPTTGMLPSYARMVQATPPQVRQMGQTVQEVGPRIAQVLRQPEAKPTMSGVGAAVAPEAVVRSQMAEQLRVPIKLTKGQATRELGQQQFEIETAKTYPQDVGKPIIQAKLDQNQRILSNFDAFIEPLGAKTAAPMNLYEVGKVVDSAVVKRATEAKKKIRDAYKLADEAGETQELIDVKPLQTYLNGLEAEAINAPIITSAKMKLDTLAPNGQVSINQLEEVRKMVGRLSGGTPTNSEFGREITKLIDASTEGKGGNLYQDARKLRANYAREFENVGVVDKLLSKKAGTTDRAVALEDVFNHAILKGSLDDVKAISRTLKRAGPEGQQAFRELLAQTLEHMREGITKNIQRDANNNPIVSAKQFDTIVRNLDASGKLDYLFTKKGAEEIRNLRDTAITVYDVPQGINISNTSSALTKVFDRLLQKIPFAGPMVEVGTEALEKQKLSKQVKEAVNYSPTKMAEELKKGMKNE